MKSKPEPIDMSPMLGMKQELRRVRLLIFTEWVRLGQIATVSDDPRILNLVADEFEMLAETVSIMAQGLREQATKVNTDE